MIHNIICTKCRRSLKFNNNNRNKIKEWEMDEGFCFNAFSIETKLKILNGNFNVINDIKCEYCKNIKWSYKKKSYVNKIFHEIQQIWQSAQK